MNYENKYKEALKAAIAAHKDEDRHLKATLERIFHELKESEDEKIRKRIISALVEWNEKCSFPGDSDDMIAWLEKQNSNIDNANKEYWRGYREGKQEILDKYAELEKQGEQKSIVLPGVPR